MLLCLVSLTKVISEIHGWWCVWCDGLLIFYGCMVFHQMSIAQFIFLFYCWWDCSQLLLLLTHLFSNKLILLNGKSQSWQSRATPSTDSESWPWTSGILFVLRMHQNHRERSWWWSVVSWPVLGDICNNLRLCFGEFQITADGDPAVMKLKVATSLEGKLWPQSR